MVECSFKRFNGRNEMLNVRCPCDTLHRAPAKKIKIKLTKVNSCGIIELSKEREDYKMKNYLCWDEVTGEEFIVEALSKEEARKIADMYFEEPKIDSQISDFEAEMLGLDTY